ncbi:GNAT family N-acetyltransferase [Paraburkholderia sp. LEh10]|uniref:GNAT family N-acetyltransferase n=1 Tax=Paraburkholderia sp. LEh10 TaxID=2821353 RepID=UPI001AE60EBB|nr:GNAT family N-acetyltransferase [Paraburkholderia sp. LEh10]MBP0590971.1 GNAT family N-acetyltransferase [Paraburkholderia sp. LEh10]
MSEQAIVFQIVDDLDGFRALKREWDELLQIARGDYFQSFAFCHSTLESGPQDLRQRLHCIIGRKEGKLVVVWPLVTFKKGLLKCVGPLTPPNRSPSDVLIAPSVGVKDAARQVLRFVVRSGKAALVELWRVRLSSPLCESLEGNAAVARWSEEVTPMVANNGHADWKAFATSRVGRTRTPPDYVKRRLENNMAIRFEFVDRSDARIGSLIEWFTQHKREWAKDNGISSLWIDSEDSVKFWRELLLNGADAPCQFRMMVLSSDQEPLAVNIIAVCNHSTYLVANTYDKKYSKLSPGTVIIDYWVKWAFEQGLNIDFGPGDQQYKTYWSGGLTYKSASFLILASRWARLAYAGKQAAQQAFKRVKRHQPGQRLAQST